MTNNWTDMGNASLFVVMGANPVENHPASLAHINKARAQGAKLIVIDPRKTRTALQADRYIRHRPGTDIAFINGVVNYIITEMESRDAGDPQRVAFYNFLNQTSGINAWTDGGNVDGSGNANLAAVPGCSKYSDARFILKADGSDYDRQTVVQATGAPAVGGEPLNTIISNFPKKAASVTADPNTVYNRLKAHVAPYTTAVVADICGVTEADIIYVANAYIDNSRCSSVGNDPTVGMSGGYRATTMLYAMGLTQHTYGSQNVKSFTVLQILMGNMGRAGGGINALRGIHNVQGSTDMGLLQHLIPGYSGNPSITQNFGDYVETLFGHPLSGTGVRAKMDGSYDDAYNPTAHYLQQIGFYNMHLKFFGEPDGSGNITRSQMDALFALWPKGAGTDHITMFRNMVQDASGNHWDGSGNRVTKACVVWGQNPAVTEPNQSAVREGLEALDLLVVVDMFENETAAAKRKATGTTYLIPSCSHVEEAGSVTNSGRVLQWREEARKPAGNSKTDLELMLRFAKALSDEGGFDHIKAVWDTSGNVTAANVYEHLYANQYGWDASGTAFDDVSLTGVDIWRGDNAAPTGTFATNTVTGSEAVAELVYRQMCMPRGFVRNSDYTVGTNAAATGAMWIYDGAFSSTLTTNVHTPGQTTWSVLNRSKSRDNADPNGTLAFPGWGFAWIFNRRVFYNNADIPSDQTDYFMSPDSVARIFVSTNTSTINYSRWYRKINQLGDMPDTCLSAYVAPHVLTGRFPGHMEPYETPRADLATTWGRNTMKRAGYPAGTTGIRDQWSCVHDSTQVAGRDVAASGFPFVLTTIRCVEHFQGGPITRNNPWNVEAEPEPWVEINSLDAAALGIKTGDMVNISTARSNSTTDQEGRSKADAAGFAQGFRARVGVGLQSNQRVGQGVVAIPWHWGDRGLSTGSRANDLCIDAGDANTTIPEYKACLCKLELA